MSITAWGDDDGRPWYAIAAYPIRVTGRDVEIAADGRHVTAHLGVDRGSGKLAWMQRHASGVDMILTPWRHPALVDLPRRYPTTWRPLAGDAWPLPLPPPLMTPRRAAPAPIEAIEPPATERDGWPYPHIPLGREQPASVEEAEARVLRALRSVKTGPRVGHAARQISGDYSREWYAILRRHMDHDAEDKGHIGPVRALFEPTRRDLADVDTALGWLRAIATDDGAEWLLLRLRAADPAWSFAQIAEAHRRWPSRQAAQRAYKSACIRICRFANRSPA